MIIVNRRTTQRRLAGVALALIALAAPALAQAPSVGAPAAPPQLAPTLQFPGDVTMTGDIPFSTVRGYRPLTLDLYLPKAGAGGLPLVVFVHGGGWAGGTARSAEIVGDNFPNMFAGLAAKGYAVASVNYRLSSEAKFPAQIQDLNAALRFLRANAQRYRIDPDKVVTWGASAGAHIAMISALDCNARKLETPPADAPSTCVTALVDWFGPTTLANATPSPTALAYVGCAPTECPESWGRTNVLAGVTKSAPPMLLVHGDADTTVPLAQSEAMAQALKKAGAQAELKIVPGGNHLFRGAARSEIDAAIARTMEFIAEEIGAGR